MAPPRLIIKGPSLPMTPISPNCPGAATPQPKPSHDLKSSSIERHADVLLALIEEQRQIAVLEMRKELEGQKETLANFQYNTTQVTNAYKAQLELARREVQRYGNEALALKNAFEYSKLKEGQLIAENDALKAKMERATKVITAHLEERARMAQFASASYTSSPSRDNQTVSKLEDESGFCGGDAPATTRGRDQMVQTEAVLESSSTLPSNFSLESTSVSSAPRSVSSEEARLRVLCEQLESEKQAAKLGQVRGDLVHRKEVDDLKQSLDDLQRRYESLSNFSSQGSSSGEYSRYFMQFYSL